MAIKAIARIKISNVINFFRSGIKFTSFNKASIKNHGLFRSDSFTIEQNLLLERPVGSAVKRITIAAGDLGFDSRIDQIGHPFAYGLPSLQSFFEAKSYRR